MPNPTARVLVEKINSYCEGLNLTKQSLFKSAGVNLSVWTEMVKNDHVPKVDTLGKLADAMGFTHFSILEWCNLADSSALNANIKARMDDPDVKAVIEILPTLSPHARQILISLLQEWQRNSERTRE